MNKSAKEMFEELGYKKMPKRVNPRRIIYAKEYKLSPRDNVYIHIRPDYKGVSKYANSLNSMDKMITFDEINAIHQQLKELEWVE